ncbi:MAG: ThuA domain-containing protein [Phycisphaerae bacterium]
MSRNSIRTVIAFMAALTSVSLALAAGAGSAGQEDLWVTYEGADGPGRGKHIVLVSGDEEYRSEEALAQLGKILARHHGFKCTVLFAVDSKSGTIDPTVLDNIPGLETLEKADLMIIATRFRDLPDEQMKYIDAYVSAGKPIIGMRTATHAFKIAKGKTYERYSFDSKMEGWDGGFGRRILGETWISHHGHHGKQSSRGVIAPGMKDHPIVRGCEDIWGPTDVYTVRLPLPGDSKPLILGQVLEGMKPTDRPVLDKKNDPMMPVAWIKTYQGEKGLAGRVFATTMGAATDLESEGLRRLLVNAAYWCLGMEDKIPPRANVEIVGEYKPSPFGFAGHKKGVKPSDYSMEPTSK